MLHRNGFPQDLQHAILVVEVTTPKMPEIGDVVADKYEVAKLIGEGGMGSVFMATHTMTQKQVALKWMLPDLAQNEDAVHRFLREAQAAGRINHPNVVDIYDVGEHQGSPFLVMEYLRGEPLTDALERGGMSAAQVVDIMLPCLRGVAAAHRKGVVHRDLKPDNIFLCTNEDGAFMQPKVLDFGISKLSGNDGNLNPRLTRTGAVMGTPYYMSPEQVRGSHDVDGRCDVYAFGVILYEALTGQVPFSAETYSALVLEIATGTPKDPSEVNPDVGPELASVIMGAMAREPVDRYPDVATLGKALEPFAQTARFTMERLDPTGSQRGLRGGNVTSTPFSAEQMQQVPGRRGSARLVVGVAALVALAATGLMLLGRSNEPETPTSAAVPPATPTPPTGEPRPAGEDPMPAAPVVPAVEAVETLPSGATPPAAAAGAEPTATPANEAPTATKTSPKASKQASRKRHRKSSSRKPRIASKPVAASAPKAVEAAKGKKKRGGRTGALSVDDF